MGTVAVIGVGNVLMGDDGIGVAAVEELRGESLPDNVELYDAGTGLLDVLPKIGRCERVILVDSCSAGGRPGTVYRSRLDPDDLEAAPLGDSLHDLDVVHALRVHRLVGGELGEIILIGIEPESITLRDGLFPAVRAALPAVVQAVRDELEPPAKRRRGGNT